MILDQLLPVTAILATLGAALNVFGASLYDVRQIKRQRAAAQPNSHSLRQRPRVTVVVTLRDNEACMESCLRSLQKSNYHKLEVIVIDMHSTDGSRRVVRSFAKANPKLALRLCALRGRTLAQSKLQKILKKHAQGELIMLLKASQSIEPGTLVSAVKYFNLDDRTQAVRLRKFVEKSPSASNLLINYSLILRNRANKVGSALGMTQEYGAPAAASIYRSSVLRSILDGTKIDSVPANVTYASDAIVYQADMSLRAFTYAAYVDQSTRINNLARLTKHVFGSNVLTWREVPIVSLVLQIGLILSYYVVPIMLAYFAYLAIDLKQPSLLISAWLAGSLLIGFAVWDDHSTELRDKLRQIILMPTSYIFFYAMTLVRALAILSRRWLKTDQLAA